MTLKVCVQERDAAGYGLARRLVVGVGVAHGHDALAAQLAQHVQHAGHLRRHGHVAHAAPGLALIAAEELRVALAQQLGRHRALVLLTEEGALEVYAEALGAGQRPIHELADGVDGAHRRLLGVGKYAGEEAGDALAGEKAR